MCAISCIALTALFFSILPIIHERDLEILIVRNGKRNSGITAGKEVNVSGLEVPDVASLCPPTDDDITIQFWVKATAQAWWDNLVTKTTMKWIQGFAIYGNDLVVDGAGDLINVAQGWHSSYDTVHQANIVLPPNGWCLATLVN